MANFFRPIAALFLACLFFPTFAHSTKTTPAQAITHVMKKQFDRPDAPLKVQPVSVEGDYAVAGWIQGNKGGRALLQKEHDQWRITVCAGDGLTQASVLEATGTPPAVAQKLAKTVAEAESKLSADKRQLFASFEGMLKIDANASSHGQHNSHDAHNPHAVHNKPAK